MSLSVPLDPHGAFVDHVSKICHKKLACFLLTDSIPKSHIAYYIVQVRMAALYHECRQDVPCSWASWNKRLMGTITLYYIWFTCLKSEERYPTNIENFQDGYVGVEQWENALQLSTVDQVLQPAFCFSKLWALSNLRECFVHSLMWKHVYHQDHAHCAGKYVHLRETY